MNNSLHWFPPGAVRREAGLGRLREHRGTLGPGALQGGQGRPLALQALPFLLLDWKAFLGVGRPQAAHLELRLSFHCLFQVRVAFALNGTKNHGHVPAWGALCQSWTAMAKAGIPLTPPWPVVSPDEVGFSNMQLLHLSVGRSLSSSRPGQEGGTQELGENSRVTEGSSSVSA